ncbi:hypothetical protein SNEBB_001364 [Seison nebaliae]|nr:hypothetical protein SNEBB_001364 [Seison nebaliae]
MHSSYNEQQLTDDNSFIIRSPIDLHNEVTNEYLTIKNRRLHRWKDVFGRELEDADDSQLLNLNEKKLKGFCRKGIPSEYRTRIWMNCTKASLYLRHREDDYQRFCDSISTGNQRVLESIKLDLPRTFPDNQYFAIKDENPTHPNYIKEKTPSFIINSSTTIGINKSKDEHDDIDGRTDRLENVKNDKFPYKYGNVNNPNDTMVEKLGRILNIFAQAEPEIGYCQGMNFIAAFVLLTMEKSSYDQQFSPEDRQRRSFWMFYVFIMEVMPFDYYTSSMSGILRDGKVAGELIGNRMPRLGQLSKSLSVDWTLIVTKWLVCAFADVLPSETTYRIWDSLILEGDKILFRTIITLVKISEKEARTARNMMQFIEIVRNVYDKRDIVHPTKFINRIFHDPGNLRRTEIVKLREKHDVTKSKL